MLPVFHGPDVLVPQLPADYAFPQLFTQAELDDLVRDLGLTKENAGVVD